MSFASTGALYVFRILSTSACQAARVRRGWVRTMPAEWQVRQLSLTTSTPAPVKARSLSGNSTLTDPRLTPFALTSDGAGADCAAAATGQAPPCPQGDPMAKRTRVAAIAAA